MYYSKELHDFVWFLALGVSTGWIASVFAKGTASRISANIAVGVIGAFCGGFFAYQFNITVYGSGEVLGLSVLGAVILLGCRRAFSRPWEAVDRP